MSWSVVRRNPNAVIARIVRPVAVVLLSLVAFAVGGLVFAGHRSNELAIERERMVLDGALRTEMAVSLLQLSRTVTSGEATAALQHPMSTERAQAAIGMTLERLFGFDQSFVITPEDLVVSGRVFGETGDQRRFNALKPFFSPLLAEVRDRVGQRALRRGEPLDPTDAQAIASDVGAARLVFDGVQARFIVAVALPSGSAETAFGGLVAIGSVPVTQELLNRLSARTGHQDLHLARSTDSGTAGAAVTVMDETGAVRARIAWSPDRPGDLVLERVLPALGVALFAITLFSAFMFRHVRLITSELLAREAEATHLANHDTLSGLPNRAFFAERLENELNHIVSPEGLAVLFLDLDRFKDINDGHGHAAGDMLIRIISKRLTSVLRGADTLSRFGGDEFAIIQTGVRSAHDCASLAHRILEAVREPVEIHGTLVFVGISIGIALAPDNGRESETLMKFADVALYRAKHEGRNRYCFFEVGMDETLRMRKIVEEELRSAIANDQFNLLYQPLFSVDGRKVLGVEALVRWNHPVHGTISPAEFIPVAEQRGLIGPLGEWVLRRACEDGKRWRNITVAVNVSPIQFRQKEFVSTVARIVNETQIEANRVELELTEGVIVDDADAAESAMMELRALGLRFALDDFGTGYSSLIYLRRFAFDKIKIDRSFLESLETTGESAILVHSVVHLGRALGLTVTAEGVETPDQQRFLQAIGCHQLQGFLFCRPVPAAKIDELLGLVAQDGSIAKAVA